MSEYEDEIEEELPISLANQFGSDDSFLMRGQIDVRKMSVLRSSEDNPDTLKPSMFFAMYEDIVVHGMDFATSVNNNIHRFYAAINGRARRDMLRAEQVMKGGAVSVESEMKSPGLTDRIFRRKQVERWEEQQREQLEV